MSSFHFPAGVLLFLLFIAFLFAMGVRRIILSRRRSADLATCGQCGYAVRGAPGLTCPECGSDLREVGIVPANTRPASGFVGYILVGAALLLLLMFVMAGAVFVTTSAPSPSLPAPPAMRAPGNFHSIILRPTSTQPGSPGGDVDIIEPTPPSGPTPQASPPPPPQRP